MESGNLAFVTVHGIDKDRCHLVTVSLRDPVECKNSGQMDDSSHEYGIVALDPSQYQNIIIVTKNKTNTCY